MIPNFHGLVRFATFTFWTRLTLFPLPFFSFYKFIFRSCGWPSIRLAIGQIGSQTYHVCAECFGFDFMDSNGHGESRQSICHVYAADGVQMYSRLAKTYTNIFRRIKTLIWVIFHFRYWYGSIKCPRRSLLGWDKYAQNKRSFNFGYLHFGGWWYNCHLHFGLFHTRRLAFDFHDLLCLPIDCLVVCHTHARITQLVVDQIPFGWGPEIFELLPWLGEET